MNFRAILDKFRGLGYQLSRASVNFIAILDKFRGLGYQQSRASVNFRATSDNIPRVHFRAVSLAAKPIFLLSWSPQEPGRA